MKKIFIFIFVIINYICFAEDYSYTKFDFNPTITFCDKYKKITLKLNKTSGIFYSKEQTRHFSYIIEVPTEIQKNCAVYLCLLDSTGFQLRDKIFLENVRTGFKGFLKGNFNVNLTEDEKISGAELCFYLD